MNISKLLGGFRAQIENDIKLMKHKYTSKSSLLLFVGTWNLGGEKPYGINIMDWILNPQVKANPPYLINILFSIL